MSEVTNCDSHLSLLSLWPQEVQIHPGRAFGGGLHGRRHEHTPPTVQRWKELFGGSCCLWVGSLRGLVRGFGNEGVVLNEGTVDHGFRPVDPELDECKRDPIVAFLDHAGLAENDFLRYE